MESNSSGDNRKPAQEGMIRSRIRILVLDVLMIRLGITGGLVFSSHHTAIRPTAASTSREPLGAVDAAAAAERFDGVGGQGEQFGLERGDRGGPSDADDEELAARLAKGVADEQQVEPVA